ncbi:MAG: alpha-mannosidase [Clostridia bacterium]|nr:alpha-mannosidase [Clostridia bacterium]
MNNAKRFELLKKKVGGNREKTHFEYTFGTPREILEHITMPDKAVSRVLSQIEFAMKLIANDAAMVQGDPVGDALAILEDSMETEGFFTRVALAAAENALLPLAPLAKTYSLILCGHAHIDMNWMWGYNETVAATLSTFRTMLDLMNDYPGFTFSQSQGSVYRIVEEHDPEMMQEIKQRILEGRWEITASEWVETDKNMPSGESLINSVEFTREYFGKVWGLDTSSLVINFSPDTFGHNLNMPEIDRYCGIKYCYHCRGLIDNKDKTLYRYRSPSGAELLMYVEPYWYNSGITPHIGIGLPGLSHRMGGLKTGLVVYGVGDHGGGVTRKDVEAAIEMMDWPVFPNIRFGTFGEFFSLADKPEIVSRLPVVTEELNFLLEGCYTTQSRIKRGNRASEAKLGEAETFAAFSKAFAGGKYNEKSFKAAWEDVLFTHFHDILPGSCTRESREYAMGLFQRALARAETEENLALRNLAAEIDTGMIDPSGEDPINKSYGAGAGYGVSSFFGVPNPERGSGITRVFNLFNSTATERTEPVEITVWDWAGDLRCMKVTDEAGAPLEFALVDGGPQHYWDHKYVRFLVYLTVPAFGYRTVVLSQSDIAEYPFYSYIPDSGHIDYCDDFVLENEFIRAEFDMETMELRSFIDKRDGSEKVGGSEFAGLKVIDTQDNSMTAWTIGRYLAKHPATNVKKIHRYSFGGLRSVISFTVEIMNSRIECSYYLDKGAKFIGLNCHLMWNELAGETLPLLCYELPLSYEASRCMNDIPMGSTTRTPHNHDIPGLSYCAAIPDGGGAPLAIFTDTKYGYRFFGGSIISSLINTAHNPDPDPERGEHDFSLRIGLGSANPAAMEKIACTVNRPIRFVSAVPHKGALPPSGAFLEVSESTAAVTSVTARDGVFRIRFSEQNGTAAPVTVTFPRELASAELTDLSGNSVGRVTLPGPAKASFSVPAHSVATLAVVFA